MEFMTSMSYKIICLSLYEKSYSRGSVYLNSSYAIKEQLLFKKVQPGVLNLFRTLKGIAQDEEPSETIFVILSPSHILVPILRLFWRGKIVLDAGWPLTDAALSRIFDKWKPIRVFKSLIIDIISFNFSSRVLLESEAQASRVNRKFLVPRKKIQVLFTGFDGNSIPQGEADIPELSRLNSEKPIVTFRGSVNPESGLDIIARMSKLPAARTFNLLICTNRNLPREDFSPTTEIISRRLTNLEMATIYRKSSILIGQVSNKRRLNYTIPHKAFEAGFFKKAYVSIDRDAIRELYPRDNSVEYKSEFTEEVLLTSILKLLGNTDLLKSKAIAISESYEKLSNQEKLAREFILLVLQN